MSLETLRDAVTGGAVAIRGKALLEPAGGPGDKVFPPSHSVGERNKDRGAKYARAERRLPGGEIEQCVLLDSVQSQANRMEEALRVLWAAKAACWEQSGFRLLLGGPAAARRRGAA